MPNVTEIEETFCGQTCVRISFGVCMRMTYTSHFFCERVVNIWNRLPVDSTDFGSLYRFRNSLDAIDDKILVDTC